MPSVYQGIQILGYVELVLDFVQKLLQACRCRKRELSGLEECSENASCGNVLLALPFPEK